jgi:hypothetical protein
MRIAANWTIRTAWTTGFEGCAILSLISTAMLKDYTNLDFSQEYARTLGPSGG